MKIDKKLRKFLVYKGVLDIYIANQPEGGKIDISSSFVWATTNEGHDFWSNLSYQFDTMNHDEIPDIEDKNNEIYEQFIF